MAYNKFKKVTQLREDLGLNDLVISWLPKDIKIVEVTQRLLQELADASEEALGTEKAKSEYIVAPVLKELRRKNPDKFSSFSGYEFNVDSKLGLTGFCDFILSSTPRKAEIASPIFCLVEAKNDNVEKGIAQCGAEMFAAQLFNEREGKPRKVIFGAVTTAFSWAFLKLEGKDLLIDPNYVPLTFAEPNQVLSVLQWILDKSLKN
jgi:hypothetical protein